MLNFPLVVKFFNGKKLGQGFVSHIFLIHGNLSGRGKRREGKGIVKGKSEEIF